MIGPGSRVMVTGASGFIGGALTRRLAGQGADVRAVVRRTSAIDGLEMPGVEVVFAELSDVEQLTAAADGVHVVFSVAGSVSGEEVQQRAVNVEGARNVAQAAITAGADRLVHVSTAGIYGFEETSDADEDTPINPGGLPYARSKAEGEQAVIELAAEAGLDLSIIRPGLVYGPGSAVWTTGLFRWARRRWTLFLGPGDGLVPVVHIDDVLDLIEVLAEHDQAVGEVFNCVAEPMPTWREFLSGYAALAGRDRWLGVPVVPIRAFTRVVARLAPEGSRASSAPLMVNMLTARRRFRVGRAAALLDWRPKVSLPEGIATCEPFLREQGLLAPFERSAR